MPSDFVSNDSIDPDAKQFSKRYPSLEGVNMVVITLNLPYLDH